MNEFTIGLDSPPITTKPRKRLSRDGKPRYFIVGDSQQNDIPIAVRSTLQSFRRKGRYWEYNTILGYCDERTKLYAAKETAQKVWNALTHFGERNGWGYEIVALSDDAVSAITDENARRIRTRRYADLRKALADGDKTLAASNFRTEPHPTNDEYDYIVCDIGGVKKYFSFVYPFTQLIKFRDEPNNSIYLHRDKAQKSLKEIDAAIADCREILGDDELTAAWEENKEMAV